MWINDAFFIIFDLYDQELPGAIGVFEEHIIASHSITLVIFMSPI